MVEKQIAVRLPDNKILRILGWTKVKSQLWQKTIENLMFTPSWIKFSNIAATTKELELINLQEKRDYEMEERGDSALHHCNLPFIPENSGVVKNKPNQAILWEVQRLRTAIAKVHSDLDAFNTKVVIV
nr:uncharacterized protein LOC108944284 [Nicotiana tomentosiformis]